MEVAQIQEQIGDFEMPGTREIRDNAELDRLLAIAKAKWDAMTPVEREAMLKAQRDNYVKAEMAFGDEGTRVVKPQT